MMNFRQGFKAISLLTVILAVCSMGTSAVLALTLVTNGDFEGGSTGWTEWNSPGGWTTATFGHAYGDCSGGVFIPTPCPYMGSGSHLQQVGTQNVHGGIYQVLSVTPGNRYQVSGYWSGGVGGAATNTNVVAWFEVTVYQGTVGVNVIDAAPRPQDVVIAKKEYTNLVDTVAFNWAPFSDSPWPGGDGTFVAEESTVTLVIKVGKVGNWNYMANYVDEISVDIVQILVGGEVYATNRLTVLVPWVALLTALLLGAAFLSRHRGPPVASMC